MRIVPPTAAIIVACFSFVTVQLNAAQPITANIELQSGPLTPGLVLDEMPRPIHQLRLIVDATYGRGVLILDGNRPEFDRFGGLIGGIQTPQVDGKGDPKLIVELSCVLELVQDGPDTWRLYHISSAKLRTPLRIAARGHLGDGGPARVIVLGPDEKVRAVVECTRYGLAVP